MDGVSTFHLLENHGGVCGIVGDRTGVLSISKSDIAGLSPPGAPGVSDLPVGGRIHSYGLDAVINTGPADGKDTASVAVPVVGIDANGQGARCLHIRRHVTLRTAGKRKGKIQN